MTKKRTPADLEKDARDYANGHPDDASGCRAVALRLENEANGMKPYPTMAMRTINHLLRCRFDKHSAS
jgi:hypothetical protein